MKKNLLLSTLCAAFFTAVGDVQKITITNLTNARIPVVIYMVQDKSVKFSLNKNEKRAFKFDMKPGYKGVLEVSAFVGTNQLICKPWKINHRVGGEEFKNYDVLISQDSITYTSPK